TDNKITAIQVCYELNDDNFKREVSSLQLLNKHIDSIEKELIIFLMYNNLQSRELPANIKTLNIKDFLLND
ncbi:MAG: hypothetical protein L3J56_08080, partial [Bacteroidales bacterium]|nr:hypothetical protein [Bacteroidales bacterium]